MIKKGKLISNIIGMAISVVVFIVALSFAWYSNQARTKPLQFGIAKISSSITLYNGDDFDHDGVLNDIDNDGLGDYVWYKTVLGETYTFNTLEISEGIPTEIYTWKIRVTNNGDVNSELIISFKGIDTESQEAVGLLSAYPISFSKVNGDESVVPVEGIALGGKEYLSDYSNNEALILLEDFYVPVGETYDFVFAVELETFDNLDAVNRISDIDTYQSYQGGIINLPVLSTILQVEDTYSGE